MIDGGNALNEVDVYSSVKRGALKRAVNSSGERCTYITKDYDASCWLVTVVDLTKRISSIQGDLFAVQRDQQGWGHIVSTDRTLADLLVRAIYQAPKFIKKHYPYHEFDPRAELFFRLVSERRDSISWVSDGLTHLNWCVAQIRSIALNDLVVALRTSLIDPKFKKLVRKCKRAALKNDQALREYVSKLFNAYSRLLVVRVDLHYRSSYADGKLSGLRVSAEETFAHRERFIRLLKGTHYSRRLVGYCWKLEHGLKKGFHYHWLFFFNGAKVREDVTYGRLIGELWESVVGDKKIYWNCNAQVNEYEFPGLGMIAHNETEKRDNLIRVINYLTKPDYFLRLDRRYAGKILGKGRLEIKPERRGRPRMPSLVMA